MKRAFILILLSLFMSVTTIVTEHTHAHSDSDEQQPTRCEICLITDFKPVPQVKVFQLVKAQPVTFITLLERNKNLELKRFTSDFFLTSIFTNGPPILLN